MYLLIVLKPPNPFHKFSLVSPDSPISKSKTLDSKAQEKHVRTTAVVQAPDGPVVRSKATASWVLLMYFSSVLGRFDFSILFTITITTSTTGTTFSQSASNSWPLTRQQVRLVDNEERLGS